MLMAGAGGIALDTRAGSLRGTMGNTAIGSEPR